MKILGDRYLVKKVTGEKQEGFQVVEVQDSFVYKGQVVLAGTEASIGIGSTVLFAKYSPDTHEVDHEGEKMKIISGNDILAVYE